MKVIDAWVQHPTEQFLAQPFFDSLQRWSGNSISSVPIELTVELMQKATVEKALISAWYAPNDVLISNEEALE